MLGKLSLKQRVIVTLTGAVALFVGLLAVLATLAMHAQEDDFADEQAQAEVQRVLALLSTGELAVPAITRQGSRVQAFVSAAGAGVDAMPAALRDLAPGTHELHPHGATYHASVVELQGRRIVAVFNASASERRVEVFGWWMFGLWAVCTLTAAWLARSMASRVVGPMLDVTQRIAGWLPGARGLTVDRHDEAGLLIEAFNSVQDRVDESIAREREFASNLDHEIRTPLAALRTDAELIGLEPGLSAGQSKRLNRVLQAVDEIGTTLAATKAMHEPGTSRPEPVLLQRCVLDAWRGMEERAAAAQLQLLLQVAPDQNALLDRDALLTVVRNLIRNAIDHAAPATLTVSGNPLELNFSDDGAGIADAELPLVFERYYRGSRRDVADASAAPATPGRRRGLGLAIAKRICDLQGWHLSVRAPPAPARGSCFTLAFPASLPPSSPPPP